MARKIIILSHKTTPTSPFISLQASTARWRALVWSALLAWLRQVDEGVERDLRTLVETGASEKDALSVLTSTGVTIQGSYLGDHRARTRLQHWRWGRDPRAEEVEEMADAVSSILFNEVDADVLHLDEMDEMFSRALPCLNKLEPPPPQGGVQGPLALPERSVGALLLAPKYPRDVRDKCGGSTPLQKDSHEQHVHEVRDQRPLHPRAVNLAGERAQLPAHPCGF